MRQGRQRACNDLDQPVASWTIWIAHVSVFLGTILVRGSNWEEMILKIADARSRQAEELRQGCVSVNSRLSTFNRCDANSAYTLRTQDSPVRCEFRSMAHSSCPSPWLNPDGSPSGVAPVTARPDHRAARRALLWLLASLAAHYV